MWGIKMKLLACKRQLGPIIVHAKCNYREKKEYGPRGQCDTRNGSVKGGQWIVP